MVPPEWHRKYLVTFNSTDGNQLFVVHKNDGTMKGFNKESRHGLYFMNTATTATVLVNTIEDNKSRYTNCNYSHAVLARKLQYVIGRPSTRSYLHIVEKELLPNCLPYYVRGHFGRRKLPERHHNTYKLNEPTLPSESWLDTRKLPSPWTLCMPTKYDS